jgi:hypothetical protein
MELELPFIEYFNELTCERMRSRLRSLGSNPQAAIVSLVPITFGDKVAAEAAAQQSKRNRTSALAFKKNGWIANHSNDPSSRRPVLQNTY